jgi:hypothetical protein
MAKKMLINADMLLATPRRNETIEPISPKIGEDKSLILEKEKVESVVPEQTVTVEKTVIEKTIGEERKVMEVTSVQRGLKLGETRATFIVKEDSLEKIKAIAYWDRQNIKDVVQAAIEDYIKQYENAKGKIQSIV